MTKPGPRAVVEDHYVDTAEQMLDLISPRHPLWEGDAPRWVFRGHADAEWSLKAKAVRSHSLFHRYGVTRASLHPGYVPPATPDWSERAGLQERMLVRFREGLDRAGLVIPWASPRIEFGDFSQTTTSAEPPREAFPLLALAQHHGLPTILLDWSRRAAVAAYFAAASAADPDDPAPRAGAKALAVWALERAGLRESSEGPNFYEAPAGTNPNLHAQAGLFSWLTSDDDPSLEQHLARIKKITGRGPRLRRISLPLNQAGKLLRMLSQEGVDGASMFPGADGIVRAMRESTLWDVPSF